jgi:lysophospholipase L1-like esterase
MSIPRRLHIVSVLLFAFASVAFSQEHWVATWAASPQETRAFTPPANAPQAGRGPATGGGQQAAFTPPIVNFHDETVRMIVRTSIGGRRLRLELSNAFGTKPLMIGAAHVALREKDSAIVTGSDRALAFSGKPSFTIPPGAQALSDAVDLDVPQLSDLVVSVYLPSDTGLPTTHSTGLHTTYISPGDLTGAAALQDPKTSRAWYFISGVDVLAPPQTGVVVAFGDSITDGATSTVDADHSWPSLFAKRVLSNSATANVAVVNEGISGNRVLRDQAGVNALARLDRDVFSQPGVKWMTVMEGINDIGRGTQKGAQASDVVTAEEVIAGLRQIVERAHLHGIKVLGATLTPYEGAAYYSETGETMRQAVNSWIRTGGAFDAVVDFDSVVRDPANPKQIRADFNIRDHLHPNDAGYQAMADAIDLAIFSGGKQAAAR